MQMRVTGFVFGAFLLCSSIGAATACSSDSASPPSTTNVEQTTFTAANLQDERSSSDSALSFDGETEFAFPNWMLLLDHEGESFTSLSASQLSESKNQSAEIESSDPFVFVAAEVSLRQFFVDDDEDFTPFSVHYDDQADHPEATGSSSMADLAINGFEDR
jgi:hypothetical protein